MLLDTGDAEDGCADGGGESMLVAEEYMVRIGLASCAQSSAEGRSMMRWLWMGFLGVVALGQPEASFAPGGMRNPLFGESGSKLQRCDREGMAKRSMLFAR